MERDEADAREMARRDIRESESRGGESAVKREWTSESDEAGGETRRDKTVNIPGKKFKDVIEGFDNAWTASLIHVRFYNILC